MPARAALPAPPPPSSSGGGARRRRPARNGSGLHRLGPHRLGPHRLGLLGGLALLPALLAPLSAPAAAAGSAAQPSPSIYVEEDFTRATAPDFLGYGSACLTGAPAAASPPANGTHTLGGCPPPSEPGGPVPPPGADGHGYLQLTDARTDQSGAALYNHPIPAEDGLVVSFEQWQYGPTAVFNGEKRAADGISFFLVDGDATLDTPGAFGGSLGYAQKNDPVEGTVPGVEQGYLGVGLDVLGNYFNDGEGRGSGCPADQRSPAGTVFPSISSTGPNMVTVRGPGDGLDGYCFLDATYTGNHSADAGWESSLPGELHGPTTEVSDDPVQAERDLEPSKRTVTVEISPAPDPVMTVWIDFHDGNGPQAVLSRPAPGPVPSTYKFGFAGSTGVWSNVHLIRNVVIGKPAPALSIAKSVPDDLPVPLSEGDSVPYSYTVTNTGNTELDDVTVVDDRLGPISCPQTTLAPGAHMTCTGTGTVTAADAERGHVTNTATATATHDGKEVGPEKDDLTLPVRGDGGAVTVRKVDAHNGEPLTGAVFQLWRESNGVPGLQTGGSDPDTRTGSGCATDTKGLCVFSGLSRGTYYLLETAVPDGYRLPENPVTGPFTVAEDEHLSKKIANPRDTCGKGKGKGCK
ncbi:hypothetical protein GCM10009801_69800 [Streptomyces albiaxialis]|uniref:Prealbumin-like fold domain-containing protein n=1 Tax=Streptomyces albiaxialis TaxID=329523 RepID=A0ABP5IE96_9ACTN